MPLLVVLVAFFHAACDAAGTDAREEACVAERVRKQLVQTRKGLVVKTDEKKEVGADDVDDDGKKKESMCPWHMTEGKGCHQHSIQKAKCADGNYTWHCKGHGGRQQCPCDMPYMCNLNKCGSEEKEHCCEKSCEHFYGIRDCDGKPEIEPTGEPVMPFPEPTPVPVPEPTPEPTPVPFSTVVNHQCSQEKSLEQASTCVGDMSAGNGDVMAFVFGTQAQAEQGNCQWKKCGAGGRWVNWGDGKTTHENGKVKCPAWLRNNENYIWKITLGNKIYISTEKHANAHGTNPSKGC